MENKIITRRRELERELESVRYKIANWKNHFSRDQIRCWYKRRDAIIHQLAILPSEDQVRQHAHSTTHLVKQILKKL